MEDFKGDKTILKEWGSVIISILALGVSLLVAWFSTLRKANLVAVFSGIGFKRYSSKNDGVVTDRIIFPLLIIKNTGAQNGIIEMIRLKFIFDDGKICYACPSSKPQANEERHFIGFTLSKGESWENSYPFFIRTEDYNILGNNKGRVFLEAKILEKEGWHCVKTNLFNFYATKEFLLSMPPNVGDMASYIWSDTVMQKFVSSNHKCNFCSKDSQ